MVESGGHSSTDPGGPADSDPVRFPSVQPTGDPSVDEVLRALAAVPELDESDLPGAYDRLHDNLLSELNTEHR